VNTF
jgi:hypothetical protein